MEKHTKRFHISGMTCTSCEVIIERKLKKIDGVVNVNVHHSQGICDVTTAGKELKRSDVEQALSGTEYELVDKNSAIHKRIDAKQLLTIGVTVVLLYIVLSTFGLFSIDTAVGATLSYGAIFGIGLVASVSSCVAVVGGLVLTFTATVKKSNPQATRWQLFRAHLFFNSGRLLSYFLLGGVVAVIGSELSPSPRVTGLLSLLAALVMIFLALDLLGISGSSKWIPRLPKRWSHRIHNLAEREEWWIPVVVGALTFFLPCGFTQSMQIYALSTGSFWHGALTMLVFALGTVPALLGIGAIASFSSSRGKAYQWFMLIAGSIVLLLGLYNAKNSLQLLGIHVNNIFSSAQVQENSEDISELSSGVQIVHMSVDGLDYVPSTITIQKDIPVQWVIDGSNATGCTSVITIPSMNISKSLNPTGETVVEFTPTKTGTLPFTCGMGMAYGEFSVE